MVTKSILFVDWFGLVVNPPANIPLVRLAAELEPLPFGSLKLPKSNAFPVVSMITKYISIL